MLVDTCRPARPLVCLCGLVVAALSPLASAQPSKAQWHADIASGYAELVVNSGALQQQAQAYCQATDELNIDTIEITDVAGAIADQRQGFLFTPG